jgi:plasmid stability protein
MEPPRPRACADESWVFASVRREADRERVTALTGQAIRHLEAFGGIPRRSPGSQAPKSVAHALRVATKWQPLGLDWEERECFGLARSRLPAANGWDLSVEKHSVSSILMRGLGPRTVQRLKERARANGRSLQQETREILGRAAGTVTMREARRLSERWRYRLGRRSFSDSARLIREDRDSR